MRGVRIKYTKPKRVARPAYFRGLYHLKAARCPGTVASRSRAKQGGDTEPRATTLRMAWPARGPLRMASIQFTSSCCNCMHYDCVLSLHPAFPWADGCIRGAPAQTASAALSTTSHGPGTMAGAGLAKAPLTRKNLCCSSPGRAVAAPHQL